MNKELTSKQGERRLDVCIVERLPNLSRASVVKLIEQGRVKINGKIALKPSYKLRENDKLIIDYDAAEQEKIPIIELPIIYEDEDCVVIDKPVGLLSHSKGAFNPEPTVATWLSSHIKD